MVQYWYNGTFMTNVSEEGASEIVRTARDRGWGVYEGAQHISIDSTGPRRR